MVSANLRRRNIYTALSASLLALTFLFYPNMEGMAWMMWRDATPLALTMAGLAVLFAVLRWKTPRD
jgi:hypothetical protein